LSVQISHAFTTVHQPYRGTQAPLDVSVFPISSSASAEWAYAPPARISAATQIASISSSWVAPWRNAALVCPLIQYGHCVVCATATAMSCLTFTDSAPSAKTFWLNAWNAASVSGASSRRFLASSPVAVGYIPSDIVFLLLRRHEQ